MCTEGVEASWRQDKVLQYRGLMHLCVQHCFCVCVTLRLHWLKTHAHLQLFNDHYALWQIQGGWGRCIPRQHITVFCTRKISPVYEPQYTVETRYIVMIVCRSSIYLAVFPVTKCRGIAVGDAACRLLLSIAGIINIYCCTY